MRCCGNHLECIVQSCNFGAMQSDISSKDSEKIKGWNAVIEDFTSQKNWVAKTAQFWLYGVIWNHFYMEFRIKKFYL